MKAEAGFLLLHLSSDDKPSAETTSSSLVSISLSLFGGWGEITNQLYKISTLMHAPSCITFLSLLMAIKAALLSHSLVRALDGTILGNLLALPRAHFSALRSRPRRGTRSPCTQAHMHALGPWDLLLGWLQPLFQPVKHSPFTDIANKVRHKSKICSAKLLPVLLYSGKSHHNIFSGKLSPIISFHLVT